MRCKRANVARERAGAVVDLFAVRSFRSLALASARTPPPLPCDERVLMRWRNMGVLEDVVQRPLASGEMLPIQPESP